MNIPELVDAQRKAIAKTLQYWASVHPRPDDPIVFFPVKGTYMTPRMMAQAAAAPDSPDGQALYRIFAIGLIDDGAEPPETLDEILDDFRREADQWVSRNEVNRKIRPLSP